MEYNPEMNAAPRQMKRPALTVALLFAGMAAGMFLRDMVSAIRSVISIGVADGALYLNYLTGPVLLFIAALLLVLYLAGPYRRGSRPIMVGIAWLFVFLMALFTLIGSIYGAPIRYLFRNVRWITPLLMLILGVLALIAGILTMAGRGWKPVAIIAAIFGILSRVASFILSIILNRNNPGIFIMDLFLSMLPYVLFYLAMLFFAIRYRSDRQ